MALCPAEKKRRQNKHRRIVLENTADPYIVAMGGIASNGLVYFSNDDGVTWNTSDYYTSAGLSGGAAQESDIRQHPTTGEWYITRGPSSGTSERVIKSDGPDLSTCNWTDVTGGLTLDFGDGHLYNNHSIVTSSVFGTLAALGSNEDILECGIYVDSTGTLSNVNFTGNAADDGTRMYTSGTATNSAEHPTSGILLVSCYRPILDDPNLTKLWSEDGGATWDYDNDLASMLGTCGCCYCPYTDRFIIFDDGSTELAWVAGANAGHSSAATNWTNVATGLSGTQNFVNSLDPNRISQDGKLLMASLQGDLYQSDDTVYNAWSLLADMSTFSLPQINSFVWDQYNERYLAIGTATGDGYLMTHTDNTLTTWEEIGTRQTTHEWDILTIGDFALGA